MPLSSSTILGGMVVAMGFGVPSDSSDALGDASVEALERHGALPNPVEALMKRNSLWLSFMVALVFAAGACGGGHDDPPSASPPRDAGTDAKPSGQSSDASVDAARPADSGVRTDAAVTDAGADASSAAKDGGGTDGSTDGGSDGSADSGPAKDAGTDAKAFAPSDIEEETVADPLQ
jgi:hypothetical protein